MAIIINDQNWQNFVDPVIDGEQKTRGLKPRNYNSHPVGYSLAAPPFDIELINPNDYQSYLDDQIANKSSLIDIRNRGMFGQRIPSVDQNGRGYCWSHSGVSAMLLARAVSNQPYVDLSAYAVACIIKQFRDEGGWGLEGIEFVSDRGVPSSQFWPQRSVSRSNDNPATWANAKLHRWTEWMDGEPKNKAQLITSLLLNIPVVADYNWWSHSVCALAIKQLKPVLQIYIWNSWGDQAGENGIYVLEGNRAIPDGMVMPRVGTASQV